MDTRLILFTVSHEPSTPWKMRPQSVSSRVESRWWFAGRSGAINSRNKYRYRKHGEYARGTRDSWFCCIDPGDRSALSDRSLTRNDSSRLPMLHCSEEKAGTESIRPYCPSSKLIFPIECCWLVCLPSSSTILTSTSVSTTKLFVAGRQFLKRKIITSFLFRKRSLLSCRIDAIEKRSSRVTELLLLRFLEASRIIVSTVLYATRCNA